ncbi:MAG TPA: hypothetical protein VI997_11680 [Candidatus Thermoplasmatota archaeon]|nr:hypothetical protein [Candidatus Thermoplasmatota archaeon]
MRPRRLRALVLVTFALLAPFASHGAAGPSVVSAVGAFVVDTEGRIEGANLDATLDPSTGALAGVAARGAGGLVLDALHVDGFGPASRITGEGTSALVVEGEAATLTLHDTPQAPVLVEAREATSVQADLADGVAARLSADGRRADLFRAETVAGNVFLLGDGRLAQEGDGLVAGLEPGARLLWRAAASGDPSWDRAAADALASGALAAEVATDLVDSRALMSVALYADGARLQVSELGGGLSGSVRGARAVAFDLGAQTLRAADTTDVSVAVDGAPADAVVALANGRVHALVALPDDGMHRVIVSGAGRGEGRDGFGAFSMLADGLIVGDFVSMRSDAASGVLSNYTLGAGTQVFASVLAGASGFTATAADGASRLVLESREVSVEASDASAGDLRITAFEATDARFALAPRVRATDVGERVVELAGPDGFTGGLVVAGVDREGAAGPWIEVADGVVVAHLVPGSVAMFRSHAGIESELSATQRSLLHHALADGALVGHVLVQTRASLAADGHSTTATASSFLDDVEVFAAATRDAVEITVSSTATKGRTLLVSLDRETVPGMAEGHAEIRVDGEPLSQATTYADVLDAGDDAGHAEYFVLAGSAGEQVLVSVPHFSTRSIKLSEKGPLSGGPPVYMYATIVLSVLVVAESAWLARRGRS